MQPTQHRRRAKATRTPGARWLAVALALAGGPLACAGAPTRGAGSVPPLQPFQIREVQRELRLRGLPVEPSGVLDEPTGAAIARFQATKGLPTTGLPDLATLGALGVDPDPRINCEMNNTVDCAPPAF